MGDVKKRFQLALDLKRPAGNRDFEVVEGDSGNVLEITLTDDGAAVDLQGCRVVAVFSKPNGTASQDTEGNGITLMNGRKNTLIIELYPPSFSPGLVECELLVFSGEAQDVLVTSARFNFKCKKGIAGASTLLSRNEWPLLVNMLKSLEQAVEAERVRQLEHEAASLFEEFSLDKSYVQMNKVAYSGSSYLCLKSCTGIAPPEPQHWLLIASKGLDGTGTGDMREEVYAYSSGIVKDAKKLNSKEAADYALAADLNALLSSLNVREAEGEAPDFLLDYEPELLEYVDGMQWTVRFNEGAEAPTLNVCGLGAAPLLEAYGKAAKIRAGQVVRVMRLGSAFFTLSGASGISLPENVTAGDTVIFSAVKQSAGTNSAWNAVASSTFTAKRAGVYRVKFGFLSHYDTCEAKLMKNGVDLAGSLTTFTELRSIDVSLAAGDKLTLHCRAPYDGKWFTTGIFVCADLPELKAALSVYGS